MTLSHSQELAPETPYVWRARRPAARHRLICFPHAGGSAVAYRSWTPSPAVAAGLQADWEDLMGAIGAGRGGSLSAREGRWLQVRPKAAHAGVRTLGPSADGVAQMLPLGFYLRPTFTRQIFAEKL